MLVKLEMNLTVIMVFKVLTYDFSVSANSLAIFFLVLLFTSFMNLLYPYLKFSGYSASKALKEGKYLFSTSPALIWNIGEVPMSNFATPPLFGST